MSSPWPNANVAQNKTLDVIADLSSNELADIALKNALAALGGALVMMAFGVSQANFLLFRESNLSLDLFIAPILVMVMGVVILLVSNSVDVKANIKAAPIEDIVRTSFWVSVPLYFIFILSFVVLPLTSAWHGLNKDTLLTVSKWSAFSIFAVVSTAGFFRAWRYWKMSSAYRHAAEPTSP
jgi:hypothetical protein